ncbi:hypothetical protein [Allorhizocola rhizosphaerae]|uniref:hypothetical protein n=1 Tax=Allorhizocola rhizosphaerae TaxID=1872709 RepID=UPI000E3C2D3E|nr:hypothetical protein [Allorhizocola rhizosphaerae]
MWYDSCLTLVSCYRVAGGAVAALLGLGVLIGAAFNLTAATARDPWWDRLLGIVDVDGSPEGVRGSWREMGVSPERVDGSSEGVSEGGEDGDAGVGAHRA